MKEIFEQLAIQLIADIGDKVWAKSILNIVRLEGCVRFSAVYFDSKNKIYDVDVNFGFNQAQLVHKLYQITQEEFPIHANWNKAEFTLYPTRQVEIKYDWDQELQDKVDKYNE